MIHCCSYRCGAYLHGVANNRKGEPEMIRLASVAAVSSVVVGYVAALATLI